MLTAIRYFWNTWHEFSDWYVHVQRLLMDWPMHEQKSTNEHNETDERCNGHHDRHVQSCSTQFNRLTLDAWTWLCISLIRWIFNSVCNSKLLPKFWRPTVHSIMQVKISSAICKGLTIVYFVYSYLLRPHTIINCVNVVIFFSLVSE